MTVKSQTSTRNHTQEMILEKPFAWKEVQHIVDTYQLEKLGRSESQLQDYHDFKAKLEARNVNIATNLIIHSLHWLPNTTDERLSPQEALKLIKYEDPKPFCNPNDVFITLNDFPYYIKERTLHLLVWVKFPMLPDINSEIGDIDKETKEIIEKYVNLTFVKKLNISRDNLIWWKNYTKIQSIKSIPHIHVLVNLDDDYDGQRERKVLGLLGTAGVMFSYPDPNESKL
jgi:hypothetical protein